MRMQRVSILAAALALALSGPARADFSVTGTPDPKVTFGNPNTVTETIGGTQVSFNGSSPVANFGDDFLDLSTSYQQVNNSIKNGFNSKVQFGALSYSLLGPSTTNTSSVSYTNSSTEDDATDLQLRRIPKSLAKAAIDYHPMDMPFGLFASVNYVGKVIETLGGVRTEYGDYAVVDVGARFFIDMERHHRIDFNVKNLFDKDYATHLTRGFPDDGGPAYAAPFLGTPRTLYARYTYSFF